MEEEVYSKGIECGFPTAFCPSDHVPIGAIFEILPQTQQALLSPERERVLTRQWDTLRSQRPPKTRGKPGPEELAASQNFAANVKAWKEAMKDDALEFEFVTKLIKKTKK